jgi:hypothetical protein
MTTLWKDIPGYEGSYQASNHGEIRSVTRERLLNYTKQRSGHISVKLARVTHYVHALVLLTFVGPKPTSDVRIECRHLDGNPANNHVHNLKWGTVQENRKDRQRLHEVGVFSASQVRDIKIRLRENSQIKVLAAEYGVDRHTISNIKNGKTYANIVV